MDYRIVDGKYVLSSGKVDFNFTARYLEEEINRLIQEGWQPAGGISQVSSGELIQAMVKYEDERLDFRKFDSDEVKAEKIAALAYKEEIKVGDKVDASLKVRVVEIESEYVLVSLFDRSGEEVEAWIPKSGVKKAE